MLICYIVIWQNDLDKSSSWAAVFIVVAVLANMIHPLYGSVVGLILNIYPQFFKGTEGANQYGEDPV